MPEAPVDPSAADPVVNSGTGGDSPAIVNLSGDGLLAQEMVNRPCHFYLALACSLALPSARPGDWILVQNSTLSTDGFALTVLASTLWTGSNKVLAANDFVLYRAMDKDGAWLWREI